MIGEAMTIAGRYMIWIIFLMKTWSVAGSTNGGAGDQRRTTWAKVGQWASIFIKSLVADRVLFVGAEFGEMLPELRIIKDRVVAEAVLPLRCEVDDLPDRSCPMPA